LSLVGLLLAIVGCRHGRKDTGSGEHPPIVYSPANNAPLCPIDGLPTTEEQILRRPLAVMIENSPQARPQSGLTQACAVYEAITEGGITRFLAIYLHADPPSLGPVRSARPHFINLEREYNAAYVHCGESYEALQILAYTPGIYDVDQLKQGKPFRRDTARKAPHNLYTSSEKLRALLTSKGWNESAVAVPQFVGQGTAESGVPAPEVRISFGGAVRYGLRWVYDAQRAGYLRYMDGKLHIDRETGEPIVARNILIQRVEAQPYPDDKLGTYDVSVIGNGEGVFMTAGRQTPMQWRKDTDVAITVYTDAQGHALPFQAGQTWVELVPSSGKVSFPTPPAPPRLDHPPTRG